MAAKSLPPCEVIAPTTFSKTTPTLSHEPFHQPPERPERSASVPIQPGAVPGQRQVLTWKRGPDQVGLFRHIGGRQVGDVLDLQFRGSAKVRPVRHGFLGAPFVGERASPAAAEPEPGHATARKELVPDELAPGRFAPKPRHWLQRV